MKIADEEETKEARELDDEDLDRVMKHTIFIETEESNLSYSNSLWEIQRLKTFKGGPGK
jgi:hypothetical protein